MSKILILLILNCVNISVSLLCYNCSATQKDWSGCGGDFINSIFVFNDTRHYLTHCPAENAMCFVRSWMARSRNSWLVQRGCYFPSKDDTLPRSVNIPTRAMTCKHERLPDAEYKVCLCKADWCNSENLLNPGKLILMFTVVSIIYSN